jgi:hypothetical protein
MKKCSKCKEIKTLNEFYKDKHKVDGITSNCKICVKQGSSLYYNQNRETVIERTSKYGKKYMKKYVVQNIEYFQNYRKSYRESNPDYQKQYHHQYYVENKESLNEYQKEWNKINIHSTKWRSLLSETVKRLGQKKESSTSNLLKYSALELKEHLDSLGMIWDYHQIDHKVPITWFKEDTPPHIVNDLRNLQPLSPEENQIKGNRFSSNISEDYLKLIKPFLKNNLEI